MKLIHFNCCALVGYAELGPDDEEQQLWPRNFGLYLSDLEARIAIRGIEQERERKWSEQRSQSIFTRYYENEYPPKWRYHIIPLSEITCKDFDELDQAILDAAKLRAKGVGVPSLNEQLRSSIAMEEGEMGLMKSNPIRQRGIAPLVGIEREQSED